MLINKFDFVFISIFAYFSKLKTYLYLNATLHFKPNICLLFILAVKAT